jgi:hypothetical protein
LTLAAAARYQRAVFEKSLRRAVNALRELLHLDEPEDFLCSKHEWRRDTGLPCPEPSCPNGTHLSEIQLEDVSNRRILTYRRSQLAISKLNCCGWDLVSTGPVEPASNSGQQGH